MKNSSMTTQVPGLQKRQRNCGHHEQQFLADRKINAEIEPEEEAVIQIGEAANDDDGNRPPAAPVAIVKPFCGCCDIDPDHRDREDPGLPLGCEVKRGLEPKRQPDREEGELHGEISGAVDAALWAQ
jgi:hypothetical protein